MTIEFFRGGSGGRVGGGSPGGRIGGWSPGRISSPVRGYGGRFGSPVRVGYGGRGWRGPRGPGGGWGWRRPYGYGIRWGGCPGPYCPRLYGYDITSFPDDFGDVEYIVDGEVDTTGMDCQQLDEDNIICYQSTMPAP